MFPFEVPADTRFNDFHKLWRVPDVLGNLFRTPERLDRKYGPSGQLLESNSTQGLTRFEYDAEGNLVKKTITPPKSPEPTMVLGSGLGLGSGPNADKIWLCEWNSAGHLSSGRRITKNITDRVQTFEKSVTINKVKQKVRVVIDNNDSTVITMFPALRQ